MNEIVKWCEDQGKKQLSWPPGMLGTLAQFIWEQSLYPNREVSIATAVFIFASQFGRAYNVKGLGLNHYLHLIAGTGSGKNSAKRGIGEVYKAVQTKLTEPRHTIRGTILSSEALRMCLAISVRILAAEGRKELRSGRVQFGAIVCSTVSTLFRKPLRCDDGAGGMQHSGCGKICHSSRSSLSAN
jgi:hypothetical protein